MNEHDLFKAIGSIDERLLQSETSRRRMRPLAKVFLIAAVIAAISVSAMAAPTVYSALKGGALLRGEQKDMDEIGSLQLFLDIEAAKNAPQTLEQAYILTALLDGSADDQPSNYRHLCAKYDDFFFYWCGAYRFEQYIIPKDTDSIYNILRAIQNSQATIQMKTYANIDVLELIFESETYANRQLYWSDGNYIFYLMLPLDADASQILSTMTVFTDMKDYLNEPVNKPPMLIP